MTRGLLVAIGLALSAAFLAACAPQDGTAPNAYPVYGSAPPGGFCGALGNCPSNNTPYDMRGNPGSF